MGRRLYETMLYWETADHDPPLGDAELEWAALWNPLPKVVFSTALSELQGNARLATGSLAEEIERLRALLHAGPFVVQSIGGRTELVGPHVVMAHRLLKSGAATLVRHAAYALVTDAAAKQLDVPKEGSILPVEATEHYLPVHAPVYSVPGLPG